MKQAPNSLRVFFLTEKHGNKTNVLMITVCVEWLDEMKFLVDVQLLCLCHMLWYFVLMFVFVNQCTLILLGDHSWRLNRGSLKSWIFFGYDMKNTGTASEKTCINYQPKFPYILESSSTSYDAKSTPKKSLHSGKHTTESTHSCLYTAIKCYKSSMSINIHTMSAK